MDDGYSGANFDRPARSELVEKSEHLCMINAVLLSALIVGRCFLILDYGYGRIIPGIQIIYVFFGFLGYGIR